MLCIVVIGCWAHAYVALIAEFLYYGDDHDNRIIILYVQDTDFYTSILNSYNDIVYLLYFVSDSTLIRAIKNLNASILRGVWYKIGFRYLG